MKVILCGILWFDALLQLTMVQVMDVPQVGIRQAFAHFQPMIAKRIQAHVYHF
jgi:hypothetical protein